MCSYFVATKTKGIVFFLWWIVVGRDLQNVGGWVVSRREGGIDHCIIVMYNPKSVFVLQKKSLLNKVSIFHISKNLQCVMFHFNCCHIHIHIISAAAAASTTTSEMNNNNNNDWLGIFCHYGILHQHYIIIYINVCPHLFFQRIVHEYWRWQCNCVSTT